MPQWKQIVVPLVLAGFLSAARPAAADEPESHDPDGLDFGIRLGYGIPLGSLSGGTDFSSAVRGLVAVMLEAGRRFDHNYTIGPFFQYGRALIKPNGSSSDYVFGLQGLYIIDAPASLLPWIGLGIGYEILDAGDGTSIRGLQFASLQGGNDFRVTTTFSLGPYVNYSIGQFSTVSTSAGDQDVTNASIHSWLQLGVHGAFRL